MRQARAAIQRLLRKLKELSTPGDKQDFKMLREIQKCPDSSKATALLADAVARSNHCLPGGERLCPDASWIHPFV